ncbi:hypothetical protein A4R35_13695 [Thermogemmatispora tikiterensis]|uniref:Uncharacterized protein n=1 Tax=Thermogemmatispora tikiterensis TaxID=1825093 RepID=A0A328VR62_9CHLR|nr:hypothetical protein A4R35_13695 [Thermogemmatispora tikiterensis]
MARAFAQIRVVAVVSAARRAQCRENQASAYTDLAVPTAHNQAAKASFQVEASGPPTEAEQSHPQAASAQEEEGTIAYKFLSTPFGSLSSNRQTLLSCSGETLFLIRIWKDD